MKRAILVLALFAMATVGVYGSHEPYPHRFNGRWVCGLTRYEFEMWHESRYTSWEGGRITIEAWRGNNIRHYYGTFRAFPDNPAAYGSRGVIYFDARSGCGRYTLIKRFSYRWVSDSQALRRNLGITFGSEATIYHVIIPWHL